MIGPGLFQEVCHQCRIVLLTGTGLIGYRVYYLTLHSQYQVILALDDASDTERSFLILSSRWLGIVSYRLDNPQFSHLIGQVKGLLEWVFINAYFRRYTGRLLPRLLPI